jgi:hypothetical protein
MLLGSPTNRRREQFARRSLMISGLFILLLSACGQPSAIQPTPIVVTVLVPAPTQKSVPTQTSIPTNLPAKTAKVPPSPQPPSPVPASPTPAPSTPSPPKIGHGDPQGETSQFGFFLDFNTDYFLRMYVYRSDDPDNDRAKERDGQGILSVKFTITTLNGDLVYERTEKNPGYCIFGGGEPDCNPWILEDGQYKWQAGGDLVQTGTYEMTIIVEADDGVQGQWFWNQVNDNPITIDLP